MLSGIVTAILLIACLAGCAWAWRKERQPEFDAAARLPLEDRNEDTP